jgi:hypothetical protein
MYCFRRWFMLCGMLSGLLVVATHGGWAQAVGASNPPQRLELEVPRGGTIVVEADRIYLPPGASPHAPVLLPPSPELRGVGDGRGQVRVILPAGADRPVITEIQARGAITLTLPTGTRLRLGDFVPRARITFQKPDPVWRIIVEPLPAAPTPSEP